MQTCPLYIRVDKSYSRLMQPKNIHTHKRTRSFAVCFQKCTVGTSLYFCQFCPCDCPHVIILFKIQPCCSRLLNPPHNIKKEVVGILSIIFAVLISLQNQISCKSGIFSSDIKLCYVPGSLQGHNVFAGVFNMQFAVILNLTGSQ